MLKCPQAPQDRARDGISPDPKWTNPRIYGIEAATNPDHGNMPTDSAELGGGWHFFRYQIDESRPSRIHGVDAATAEMPAPSAGLGEGWYFTKSQIDEASPSRIDGIDAEKEDDLRKSYCHFIKHLGMELRLPQVAIATATIYCHRFFLRQSHSKNDRYTIATACLLLANKVTGARRKLLDDLTLISYEVLHENGDPATADRIRLEPHFFQQRKQLLLKAEHFLLTTLNFDLDIETPYTPLVSALKDFNAERWHSRFAQFSWNFVNDGLTTTVCLQFKPHQVAGAAFYLASRALQVQLPADPENPWLLKFDMSLEQLKNACNELMRFYEPRRSRTPTPLPFSPQSANTSPADYTPTGAITSAYVDSRQGESHPPINAAEYSESVIKLEQSSCDFYF